MKKYHQAEDLQLVFSGNDYFDTLEKIIDESRHTLHVQTYIFESDATGLRIAEALKRAAARQVNVYMMVDAYGSYPFSKKTAKDLTSAGVHFRLYSPLFSSESIYFGRRLHHKIIVADKKVALTGGINIADKYSGAGNQQPWLDYAVLSRGEACEYLHWLCDMFYKKNGQKKLSAFERSWHGREIKPIEKLVRYRRNDWIKGKNEIHKSYAEAIIGASTCITIVASYFLPGRTFRKLLQQAAARGVEIRIILAGKSDISSLRLAEHFMYDFYLQNNIRLFEWTNSVMHGKAMVIDNKWVTIGSYNLNFLSHYISIELNTDIIDQDFCDQFTTHLNHITTEHCNAVELKQEQKETGFFLRLRMRMAYYFYKQLMDVMMMGRKYRKRKYTQ